MLIEPGEKEKEIQNNYEFLYYSESRTGVVHIHVFLLSVVTVNCCWKAENSQCSVLYVRR